MACGSHSKRHARDASERKNGGTYPRARQRYRQAPIQYDKTGPKNKPVWWYDNGDMYLGQWKMKGPNGHPVEDGIGVTCNHWEDYRGEVYAGQWKDGLYHGQGELFWLESCDILWRRNRFPK